MKPLIIGPEFDDEGVKSLQGRSYKAYLKTKTKAVLASLVELNGGTNDPRWNKIKLVEEASKIMGRIDRSKVIRRRGSASSATQKAATKSQSGGSKQVALPSASQSQSGGSKQVAIPSASQSQSGGSKKVGGTSASQSQSGGSKKVGGSSASKSSRQEEPEAGPSGVKRKTKKVQHPIRPCAHCDHGPASHMFSKCGAVGICYDCKRELLLEDADNPLGAELNDMLTTCIHCNVAHFGHEIRPIIYL